MKFNQLDIDQEEVLTEAKQEPMVPKKGVGYHKKNSAPREDYNKDS